MLHRTRANLLLTALCGLILTHPTLSDALEVTDMTEEMRPQEVGATKEELSETEKARRLKAAESARKVLEDHGFYAKWGSPGSIRTADEARSVLEEAERELDRIEDAVSDVRLHCYGQFLVNRCIDQARRASFTREREVRRVMVAAEDFLREVRNEERKREREQAKREVREPVRVTKPRRKEASEPVEMSPRRPKAATAPVGPGAATGFGSKEVRGPSHPMPLDAEAQALEDRAAQERANEAFFAQKQVEAQKRRERAEAMAAERRADREAKKKRFEASLEERREAQKRYEERRKAEEKESGLSKFF